MSLLVQQFIVATRVRLLRRYSGVTFRDGYNERDDKLLQILPDLIKKIHERLGGIINNHFRQKLCPLY